MIEERRSGWLDIFSYQDGRNSSRGTDWTPERLLEALKDYLSYADGSPLPRDLKLSSKTGGKNGSVDEEAQRRVFRPYNIKSMCARLGIADWDKFKAKYCVETTDEGRAFSQLCSKIENFIHGSLQEGATAGIYNAKMVMGLTGVAEHVKQEVSSYSDKSDEELRAEVERLQKQMGVATEEEDGKTV